MYVSPNLTYDNRDNPLILPFGSELVPFATLLDEDRSFVDKPPNHTQNIEHVEAAQQSWQTGTFVFLYIG